MSPTSTVPQAAASSIARPIASRTSAEFKSSRWRRAASIVRIHVMNSDAGGTRSRRYDSSRCVWALTSPGRIATRQTSTSGAASGVAENLVVDVPAFGREPGVFDVPDDLDLVHAVARAGGADDVLFDHHAAHVVGAEREAELPHFPALRDPRRLQVVEVVEHNPRRRQRTQVVDAGRLGAPELRVRGL